ncbi:type VI secretion system domain-containing protein, partial [Haliangium sp. UPWRP_2]|uniref:type VI secretion system domain-containing protein n=1 Tax=Haliangium sp. UPWRP_2 TaxID=1931276 RepID=UPI0018EDCF29
MQAAAGSPDRFALANHRLATLGRQASSIAETGNQAEELKEFDAAIAVYSKNRMGVDWPLVLRVGAGLAARRCDLKLYGYLALAAFHSSLGTDESPFRALGAALLSYADLVELAWPQCVPALLGRRQSQLKWVSEELASFIQGYTPKLSESRDVLACADAADHLGTVAGKACGLDYQLMRELRAALDAHCKTAKAALEKQTKPAALSAPQTAPAPADKPKPLSEPKQESLPPRESVLESEPKPEARPTPDPESRQEAKIVAQPAVNTSPSVATPAANADATEPSREALEDQLSTVVSVLAGQLRAESLTDPAAYWMLRALRWANHDLLKAERISDVLANKHKTPLPLPQGYKTLSKQIPQHIKEGLFAAVVTECEELFATYPLWLDLQRWCCTALQEIHAKEALDAVRVQLNLL